MNSRTLCWSFPDPLPIEDWSAGALRPWRSPLDVVITPERRKQSPAACPGSIGGRSEHFVPSFTIRELCLSVCLSVCIAAAASASHCTDILITSWYSINNYLAGASKPECFWVGCLCSGHLNIKTQLQILRLDLASWKTLKENRTPWRVFDRSYFVTAANYLTTAVCRAKSVQQTRWSGAWVSCFYSRVQAEDTCFSSCGRRRGATE